MTRNAFLNFGNIRAIDIIFTARVPKRNSIVLVVALFSRETPILAGGIGVARAVVGAFLLFVFGFGTIMSQCC